MSLNAEFMARRYAAVARGVSHATPIFASRALNAEIWDIEEKRYIDFAGGISVVNTGHRHPRVIAAAQAEMAKFTHPCFQVTPYESYIALAERMNEIAPIVGLAKSIFFTTGAEATENAVKIARAATGRDGVIAFTGGFHGRTMLAMSMTGKVVPYKRRLGVALPGVWHVPFPSLNSGITTDDCLRYIDYIFKASADPSAIAAIIIEPIQGEGGFNEAPPELMRALRKIADEQGIVLIIDEIQSGFGRAGKMFAIENYDIRPDLICVAKSMAGGFPLSGVIGRSAIMDAAEPGALGGTFAGNPIACAAALAVLDVFRNENLLDRSNSIGCLLKSRLHAMSRKNNLIPIASIRGPGSMVAFDIVRERGSFEPDPDATRRLTLQAVKEGLIILSCGTSASTIRILAPLTASDAIIYEGLDCLERALQA